MIVRVVEMEFREQVLLLDQVVGTQEYNGKDSTGINKSLKGIRHSDSTVPDQGSGCRAAKTEHDVPGGT